MQDVCNDIGSPATAIHLARKRPQLALFGAAPNTGNLGVSALCMATIGGITRAIGPADFTVFDYAHGCSRATARVGEVVLAYTRCGGYPTRRIYRPESLWNIRWSAKLGIRRNAGARAVETADAVLDISGGDSFTDLYGTKRFWDVAWPKLIALELGRPLFLLPQTYGPFKDPKIRRAASHILRRATVAWARDERSYQTLKDLLGDYFDPIRHRCGVDVAFGLESRMPSDPCPDLLKQWFQDRARAIVGLNISGLIYNEPARAAQRFSLKADYREVIKGMLERLMCQARPRILLVPHVLTPEGHYESDSYACRMAAEEARRLGHTDVFVLPARYDADEIKWIIGQCDWFCGTRMHATIASLSSGVPTATIAYSDKAIGVFESCGQGTNVFDPRQLTTSELATAVCDSFQRRGETRANLIDSIRGVRARAEGQMAELSSRLLKCGRVLS